MYLRVESPEKRIQILNAPFKFAILVNGFLSQCDEIQEYSIECPEYQKYFDKKDINPTHVVTYAGKKSTIEPSMGIEFTNFGMYALNIASYISRAYKNTKGMVDFKFPLDIQEKFILADERFQHQAEIVSKGLEISNIKYVNTLDPEKIDYALEPACRAVIASTSDDMLYALLDEYEPYPNKLSYKLGIAVRTPESSPEESFYWPVIFDSYPNQNPEELLGYVKNWVTREKYSHNFSKFIRSLKSQDPK